MEVASADGNFAVIKAIINGQLTASIFSPVSGRAWRKPVYFQHSSRYYSYLHSEYQLSSDGRFAVVIYEEDPFWSVEVMTDSLHFPDAWHPHNLCKYVAIYERPGHLLARFKLNREQLDNDNAVLTNRTPVSKLNPDRLSPCMPGSGSLSSYFYPTPDRRKLLMIINIPSAKNKVTGNAYAVILKRWW